MMRQSLYFLLIAALACSLLSCNPKRIYDETQPVQKQQWLYDDIKTFKVEITDTASRYNIFIQLRHHFQFEWRNVWVKVATKLADGRQLNERVNLLLCEADGEWYGDCVGDECTIFIPLQTNVIFPDTGTYTFAITPDMRVNPLPHVVEVGLRVEKK